MRAAEVVFHHATLADVGAITTLYAESFERAWDSASFIRFISDANYTLLVARNGEKAVGFICARRAEEEAEIITFAVSPAYRRQGIAQALLQAVINHYALLNVEKIFLEVAADNPAAIALYRNVAFEQTGRRKAYYPRKEGNPADALTFTLRM